MANHLAPRAQRGSNRVNYKGGPDFWVPKRQLTTCASVNNPAALISAILWYALSGYSVVGQFLSNLTHYRIFPYDLFEYKPLGSR